jgi:excisionase family DNA binding protein
MNDVVELDRMAYGVPQAAATLSLSKATVWELIRQGKIAAIKLSGRTLIERAALRAYIEQEKRPARRPPTRPPSQR